MTEWTTATCPADVSPDCPGHEGWERFSDCLTDALYHAKADDQTGDVDGFGWWIALFIQGKAETIDHGDIKVTIPAGTCLIIRENDQGHIHVDEYESAEDAQSAFDDWEARYGAYLDECDARELGITSSTGRTGR